MWDDLAIELESRGPAALIDHAKGYVGELFGADAAAAITNAVVHPWGDRPLGAGLLLDRAAPQGRRAYIACHPPR